MVHTCGCRERRGGGVDDGAEDGGRERRLEGALQESEERFGRLVEAAKDYAIFMTDADGRVSTWNEGARRLFGYSKVARDLTELRRAEEAVDEARRAERDRLARDLHDLVLQDLVYAFQACDAHSFLARDETRIGDLPNLGAVIDSLRRASRGVRQAIHELREGETVGRALARAVGDLVEMERRRSPGIRLELVVSEGVPEELPREVCKDVLLVVSEALANARRHANARRVRVALGATEGEIRVEVTDDGAGFDPRQTPEGVGMGAMRERTALLNGTLEVLSEPAGGTTVRLRVPVPPNASA